MTIKQFVKTRLNRLGLDVTRFLPRHLISNYLRDLIREYQINLVLDVGAFHGAYCKMLRNEVGYTGFIASFEPGAQSFRILSAEMAKDRSWHGYPFALSDTDSVAVLNRYGEKGDFNSILRLRDEHARAY